MKLSDLRPRPRGEFADTAETKVYLSTEARRRLDYARSVTGVSYSAIVEQLIFSVEGTDYVDPPCDVEPS